jgi:hypothetical protein
VNRASIVVYAPPLAIEIDVLVGDTFKAAGGTNARSRFVIAAIVLLLLGICDLRALIIVGGTVAGWCAGCLAGWLASWLATRKDVLIAVIVELLNVLVAVVVVVVVVVEALGACVVVVIDWLDVGVWMITRWGRGRCVHPGGSPASRRARHHAVYWKHTN